MAASCMFATGASILTRDVISQFEEETGITVVYDLFETNEEMYPVIGGRCCQLRCRMSVRLYDPENA